MQLVSRIKLSGHPESFQLESTGIREMTVKIRPNCFEDLVAILALYRPGPLDSGMAEEIVYRLFILSCFLFSFRHLYSRIAPLWPGVVAILPKAMAVVLSSLLFAMVHNVYGFTAAFFGGMLLGLIYIQSGIESAIAAHFCANFLFFSASYLS